MLMTSVDFCSFKSFHNQYHNLVLIVKKQYYSNLDFSSSSSPKRLLQTVYKLYTASLATSQLSGVRKYIFLYVML